MSHASESNGGSLAEVTVPTDGTPHFDDDRSEQDWESDCDELSEASTPDDDGPPSSMPPGYTEYLEYWLTEQSHLIKWLRREKVRLTTENKSLPEIFRQAMELSAKVSELGDTADINDEAQSFYVGGREITIRPRRGVLTGLQSRSSYQESFNTQGPRYHCVPISAAGKTADVRNEPVRATRPDGRKILVLPRSHVWGFRSEDKDLV